MASSRSRSAALPRRFEGVRFVFAGAVNTAASLCAYWLLLLVTDYAVAYTLSFVVGVLVSFALNTYFVFRVPWSWRKLVAFPSIQGINYLLGLGLLWLLINGVGIGEAFAPLISIPATIPVNFMLTRWLMRRGHRTADPDTAI